MRTAGRGSKIRCRRILRFSIRATGADVLPYTRDMGKKEYEASPRRRFAYIVCFVEPRSHGTGLAPDRTMFVGKSI
jgi:hypothetical protein